MRLTTKLAAGSDQDNDVDVDDDNDNVADSMTSRMIGVAVEKNVEKSPRQTESWDGKEKPEQVVKKMEMSERNFSCG